jgi:hypothetical protein
MPTPVKKTDSDLAAEYQSEFWPLGPQIRAHLVKAALSICGLEVQEDGRVTNIPQKEGASPLRSRNTLSAMRILAEFDRNALELQRVDLAIEGRNRPPENNAEPRDGLPPITDEIANNALIMIHDLTEEKKAAKALEPEPPPSWLRPTQPEPEDVDPRWPITTAMRKAIMASALDLCGFRVTPEGAVEPTGQPPEKPRIVLGAMRVLARFDRLAIQHKRIQFLGVSDKLQEKRRHMFVMDPEIARKVNAFLHEERVKLRDRILAGDPEAIAAVAEQTQPLTASDCVT